MSPIGYQHLGLGYRRNIRSRKCQFFLRLVQPRLLRYKKHNPFILKDSIIHQEAFRADCGQVGGPKDIGVLDWQAPRVMKLSIFFTPVSSPAGLDRLPKGVDSSLLPFGPAFANLGLSQNAARQEWLHATQILVTKQSFIASTAHKRVSRKTRHELPLA
ncbi:MAG: hypothetical protein PHE55_15350 [Methylococcaceae bacterium]|nr:hypothetical protein [Methylococcaceae bacterium]